MSKNGLIHDRHACGKSLREVYGWAPAKDEGEPIKLDKRLLRIDRSYQRDASQNRILHIAKNFNWPAFGVVLVAFREGVYYVFDGQHRVMAALKRDDVQELPCLVFYFEDLSAEAQAFIDTNVSRGPMRAIQRFKSRIVAQDPDAMAIEALLQTFGWTLAPAHRKNGISCIDAVEAVYKRGGDHCMRVMGLVRELYGEESPVTAIVRALSYLDNHLEKKHNENLSRRDVAEKILAIGPDQLMRSARSMADALGRGGGERVHAAGIVEAINNGKRSKRIASVFA